MTHHNQTVVCIKCTTGRTKRHHRGCPRRAFSTYPARFPPLILHHPCITFRASDNGGKVDLNVRVNSMPSVVRDHLSQLKHMVAASGHPVAEGLLANWERVEQGVAQAAVLNASGGREGSEVRW